MGSKASKAASARREENNHLNDCRTFKMSTGGVANRRVEEAVNDFHQQRSENEMGLRNTTCSLSIRRIVKYF